jgi:hypothetical protein
MRSPRWWRQHREEELEAGTGQVDGGQEMMRHCEMLLDSERQKAKGKNQKAKGKNHEEDSYVFIFAF